jgi:hypothetical protein
VKDCDPEVPPNAVEWLALDEQERIQLAKAYHRDARIKLSRAEAHACFHVIVENQSSEGLEAAVRAMARLMNEGLSRHDALHAIGSVVVERLHEAMTIFSSEGNLMKDLVELELMILELDEKLKPIAQKTVDLSNPNWMDELRKTSPIDQIGKRSEAEAALSEAVDTYAKADPDTRETIRVMFTKCTSFTWAAIPPWPLNTNDGFTRHLLLFSIYDQGRDSRDALLQLRTLLATARSANLDTAAACRHVAKLSSDVDRYGMGSTRSMLLSNS